MGGVKVWVNAKSWDGRVKVNPVYMHCKILNT